MTKPTSSAACEIRIINERPDGFVEYEVTDPGGNVMKCCRRDTVSNIEAFYKKYVERVNARDCVEKRMIQQTKSARKQI